MVLMMWRESGYSPYRSGYWQEKLSCLFLDCRALNGASREAAALWIAPTVVHILLLGFPSRCLQTAHSEPRNQKLAINVRDTGVGKRNSAQLSQALLYLQHFHCVPVTATKSIR